MTETQFFYRLDTLQIDAVFLNAKTNSRVFKNTGMYVEVNVTDPPYEVTRDHKVLLDGEGEVEGTVLFPNPVQPTLDAHPNQDLIDTLRDRWANLSASQKRELIKRILLRLLG